MLVLRIEFLNVKSTKLSKWQTNPQNITFSLRRKEEPLVKDLRISWSALFMEWQVSIMYTQYCNWCINTVTLITFSSTLHHIVMYYIMYYSYIVFRLINCPVVYPSCCADWSLTQRIYSLYHTSLAVLFHWQQSPTTRLWIGTKR